MKIVRKRRRSRLRRWLAPTANLARAVGMAVAGLVMLLLGVFMSFRLVLRPLFDGIGAGWDGTLGALGMDSRQVTHLRGGAVMLAGGLFVYRGLRSFFRQLNSASDSKRTLVAGYLKRQQLAQGPRIVVLGGGTGLSTLLRGLKQYSSNITAVVTVTDDGGSSGRLSQEMGILPPGDLRNCLVALADAERLMTDLFQHRFSGGSGSLSGHSIGNLLIAGFLEQTGGDVDRALALASEVLNIRGRVIPSTSQTVRLRALMEDSEEICGETAIVSSGKRVRRIYLDPPQVIAHPQAIEAIREADLICIGPGSVYTSVVPNLLVPGIAGAIEESDAVKVYVCNVMTQRGESDQFTAAEHVVALQANVPGRVMDYVLVNTATPSQAVLDRYHDSGQDFVVPDQDRIKQMGYRPIAGNLINETDLVRHDPMRMAARLMVILQRA